jgi:hypothetical protein
MSSANALFVSCFRSYTHAQVISMLQSMIFWENESILSTFICSVVHILAECFVGHLLLL